MHASRLPLLLALGALPWCGVARAQLPEPSFVTASDSVRLAYRRMGSGLPLLVLHGGPGLGMGSLIADLAPLARDHELVFFDQRGAGHSESGDTAAATFERHVLDVDDVVQRLGLERVVVLGHSWGTHGALMGHSWGTHGAPPSRRSTPRRIRSGWPAWS